MMQSENYPKQARTDRPSPASTRGAISESVCWVVLGLILLAVALVRVRLLSFPLERDEGAFAYMAQLLLDGVPPYTGAFDFKPPGLYLLYALFIKLFGASASGIHFGLLLANAVSVVLLFLLARKIIRDEAALAASAAFAALSLSPSTYGFAAHATQFVVPFVLAGLFLFLKFREKGSPGLLFWSGLLLSVSFLVKQIGIFFVVLGFLLLAFAFLTERPVRWKPFIHALLAMAFGTLVPIVLAVLLLALSGSLRQFWFCCFVYAAKYGTAFPLSQGIGLFLKTIPRIIDGYYLVWLLAGLGGVAAVFHAGVRRYRAFLLLFAAVSFAAVCPGWYFREHYFIVLLPALGLLAGVAVQFFGDLFANAGKRMWLGSVPLLILLVAIALGVNSRKGSYFTESPVRLCRAIYGGNPFPEAVEIARAIERRTKPEDRIVVFGSEPEIYFYAKRRAATKYIFTYPLVEHHDLASRMQQEMIESVIANRPAYMVYVETPSSWMVRPGSDPRIFSWLDEYSRLYYRVEGLFELDASGATHVYWGEEARSRTVRSPASVVLLKRIAS